MIKRYLIPNFYIQTVVIVSLMVCIVAYTYFMYNPKDAILVVKEMVNSLEYKGIKEDITRVELFWKVLKNNLFLSTIMILVGIIPLFVLPLFSTVFTFLALSAVVAAFNIKMNNGFELLIFGILPHGIFEFLGFILSSSIGVYLSTKIFQKIFIKKKKVKLRMVLKECFFNYVFFVFPIILIAAIVEAFVTHYISDYFLPF